MWVTVGGGRRDTVMSLPCQEKVTGKGSFSPEPEIDLIKGTHEEVNLLRIDNWGGSVNCTALISLMRPLKNAL